MIAAIKLALGNLLRVICKRGVDYHYYFKVLTTSMRITIWAGAVYRITDAH